MQNDIHRLKNWADEWLLKLNVDKCWGTTYIVNNSNLCDTKYYFENYNKHYDLPKVDSVNNLGVRFDSKLAFLDHMNKKFNKANRILGIIKRNFIYLDKESFVLLYKAMVRPHLEYANSVWCPHKQESWEIAKITARCTFVVQYAIYWYEPAITVWSSNVNKGTWQMPCLNYELRPGPPLVSPKLLHVPLGVGGWMTRVSIPGPPFSFPGIRERPFSFPGLSGARE